MLDAVANPEPLTATEELFWRALMRIVLSLPRQLHDDMVRGAGLTASEYTVIMSLSEAPNRQLRMADLARATGLSASRTTRLVDALQSHGLVAKRASSADGRSNLAELTSLGLTKLRSAWPAHVTSVRGRVPRPHPCRHSRQDRVGARGGSGPTGQPPSRRPVAGDPFADPDAAPHFGGDATRPMARSRSSRASRTAELRSRAPSLE